MTDKVPFEITAQDKSAAAFSSFVKRADSAFASAQKASGRIGAFLTGGGVFLGFRAILRTLDDVAEKFKTTSDAAKEFTRTGDYIHGAFDSKVLSVLEAMGPALEAFNKLISPTARATRDLEGATELLRLRQNELNEAVKNGASLESAYGKALLARRDAAQKAADAAQGTKAKVLGGRNLSTELDPSGSGLFGPLDNYRADRDKEQKAAADQAKKAAESLAKYNEDIVQASAARQEAAFNAAEERMDARNKATTQLRLARLEAERKAADDAAEERAKTIQEQADAFGQTFAANLIQSGETGFKGLLAEWAKTLEQMIAVGIGKNIFGALFPKGFQSGPSGPGGWVGGIASAFGFADGGSFTVGGNAGRDVNKFALGLTRGERVTVTKPGQGSGFTFNDNKVVNIGQGVSRAEVLSAMAASSKITEARIREAAGRGR